MIDHQGVTARVRAFDTENGRDCIRLGGMLVYSNGARRDPDPLGPLIDPPDNDYERNRIVVQYWEERVRRARGAFQKLKRKCQHDADDPELPVEDTEGAVQQLTTLRAEIKATEAQLRDAKAALTACTPLEVLNRTRVSPAIRRHNADFLAEVAKIKI